MQRFLLVIQVDFYENRSESPLAARDKPFERLEASLD